MTRLLLCLALSIWWASHVTAQSVAVRSGEHETFSRLVMKLGKSADWTIISGDRLATIKIDRSDILFDTRQVFDRIPKSRLLDIAQKSKGAPLVLTLNCDCEVVGFKQPGAFLVIDIRDPKPSPFKLYPVLPKPGDKTYQFRLGSNSEPAHTKQPNGLKLTTPSLPLDPRAPVVAERSDPVVGNRLSEQRLIEQIERAASQGLLTPIASLEPVESSAERKNPGAKQVPKRHVRTANNLAAISVIDRDMSGIAGDLNNIAGGRECLPSDLFVINDWGNDNPFADQVSDRRKDLFGEFDKPNVEAVMGLARTYLFFGFGAEARATLAMLPKNDLGTDALFVVSDILDGQPIMHENPLAAQTGCPGDVALWTVLALPDHVYEVETDAVLQGFTRLPLHLRQQLGPKLSRLFNDSGQSDIASAILRSIDRSTDETAPAEELAAAEIDSATGHTKSATVKMTNVIDSGSEFSPEALIQLIDTHLLEELPLRPDLPDLAAAYAEEHRLTELGSELRRATVLSLALTGQFDEAFRLLANVEKTDGTPARNAAAKPVLDLLTENADDVSFLKFALENSRKGPETALPVALESRMAKRLLDLGFEEQAFALLDGNTSRTRSVSDRLLRAETALAVGLPHRAMIEVLSLSSPEASDIRARAMTENGDFEKAGEVLLGVERPERAARSLWLGDAWERLTPDDSQQYGRLAELSIQLTHSIESEDTLPPLAGARTLLEDSESARSNIDEILNALPTAYPEG